MILLDTHIWIWWVHGDSNLSPHHWALLQEHEEEGIGISVMSCWEIHRLVQYNRLVLPCSAAKWLDQALAYPGIQLLPITPPIAKESDQLPPGLRQDPADRIIVATSRIHKCPLITADIGILEYPHVDILA